MPASTLLRPLAWLFASASLLNLAQDLSLTSIHGKLGSWLGTYREFVSIAIAPLFTWMNWRTLRVTIPEVHALVLAFVLISAAVRANYMHNGPGREAFFESLTNYVYFGWFLGLAVLVPERDREMDPAGLLFMLCSMFFFVCVFLFEGRHGNGYLRFGTRRDAWVELAGVVGITLVVVVLSQVIR